MDTKAIVVGLAGLFMLFFAQHPFVTYPISLTVLRRLRRPSFPASQTLPVPTSVALCVCSYNEIGIIRAKVENMLSLREAIPQLEIMVYVDAPVDGTAEILREYGDVIRLVESPQRHGKTYGMNHLVSRTQSEIVVFTDANVMFAPDAIPNLLRRFVDPSVGCVCGHLIYTGAGESATATTGSLYWRLEEKIKNLEHETGDVMGADGSIFAIRRALHRSPPSDIIDDMAVSLSILCDGHRIVRAPDALAWEELVTNPAEEFHRKVRIACQALNVHRMIRSRLRNLSILNLYKYVSHKLLRWMTIYVLAASCALLTLSLLLAWSWMAVLLPLLSAAILALTAHIKPKGLSAKILNILSAFLATGIGVWRSLRGDRFQTWSPAASARLIALRSSDVQDNSGGKPEQDAYKHLDECPMQQFSSSKFIVREVPETMAVSNH